MNIPNKIADLINEEQIRQNGKFYPEGSGYLEKIFSKAELVSHDSLGLCLGFVFFYCNDPDGFASYITLLMVNPLSRKLGIGAALVRYVLTLTAQRGFKACRLEVRKENAAAINLYKSMGFYQLEDRSDRYLMETQVI